MKQTTEKIRNRLAGIERRDSELWLLALTGVGLLAAGLFFVLLPAVFMGQRTINLRADISPQLLLGLIVLVLMFIAYLVVKQIDIRRKRFESVADEWHSEVTNVRLLMDPLAQVYSRHAVTEMLSKEVKRAQRQQYGIVFVYAGVNDFKGVNRRYGPLSAELVLTEVGALLKRCVRGSDYVIRMFDDEFLVALIATGASGAERVTSRVLCRVQAWNEHSPLQGFTLGLSIGIQEWDPARPLEDSIGDAALKMHQRQEALAGKTN